MNLHGRISGVDLSVPAGISIGAGVGFLLWLTADLMLFGITNVGTVTSATLGPLVEMVPGAIAGGLVAVVDRRVAGLRPVQTASEPYA